MRLFDLSLRFKLPLWGGGLIIATALTLSTSYVVQAWDNLNRDLLQNAEDIGRATAHALFPVMLHDDVWDAFEVVSLPFVANPGTALIDSLVVLDRTQQVYVSSQPQEFPMLSPVVALGEDFAAVGREMPKAADADVFVHNVTGAQRIYVALPIASEGVRLGTLIVTYNKSLLWQRFSLILSRSLWITLLVLAVLLPVTAYWGRRMMLPMQMVTERIKRIGSGELDDIDTGLYPYGDEVGQLFSAYEAVLLKLREKAEFEKEMVKSERMAAVGRLTASIAHEINNPLGGMLNAISTLKRHGSPDPVTQKTISLLERGLSQIRETVAALLVEAKVKSRPLEASDLEDVRILVAPAAQKHGAHLSWSVTLPATVAIPSTLIRQVLINLLLNAITAAGQGGQVAVRVLVSEARFVLVVENSGRSLSPEQLARLFEPFTSFSETGNGLGLWICYQIVTQLGGTIAADSSMELTRFTVLIPLDTMHDSSLAQNLPD
ncbi:HAMP domain-containing sensor histidine kinase [Rhodoferax sp.]|uniref:sensor histidine kinase n=1 Tax=Rhodoferax sp. TaxID=50421 RepID=UPI00262633DE|nr:HAMP domain-containing sensor histidine kinase [Rhodoferax sp.]MDD2926427.1 HAMP domain-containing sensor histidine kinase [Rhodoferax sp.]